MSIKIALSSQKTLDSAHSLGVWHTLPRFFDRCASNFFSFYHESQIIHSLWALFFMKECLTENIACSLSGGSGRAIAPKNQEYMWLMTDAVAKLELYAVWKYWVYVWLSLCFTLMNRFRLYLKKNPNTINTKTAFLVWMGQIFAGPRANKVLSQVQKVSFMLWSTSLHLGRWYLLDLCTSATRTWQPTQFYFVKHSHHGWSIVNELRLLMGMFVCQKNTCIPDEWQEMMAGVRDCQQTIKRRFEQ